MENAPGTVTGSVFHQQSINYLKSPYVFIPSDGVLNTGNVRHTFKQILGQQQDSNL